MSTCGRWAAWLPVAAIILILAGCATAAAPSAEGRSPEATATTAPSGTAASRGNGSGSGALGEDGTVDVCRAVSVVAVASITGVGVTVSREVAPDTHTVPGVVSYGCVYSTDPSTNDILVNVTSGDPDAVFASQKANVEKLYDWTIIPGVGDRAEGSHGPTGTALFMLDVQWGRRFVVQVVDNTADQSVGQSRLIRLAGAIHASIGD